MKVDISAAEEWKQWMISEHIPAVMHTNCFIKSQFAKLIDIDESDGLTFIVQYFAESKADYNRYMEIHAPGLIEKSTGKWNDRFTAFRTVMEVVQ